jgi:predicted peroxiredoxin
MSGYVEHTAEGVAILLWSCDPEDPERLATPFMHAAAAAAMEVPVEMYFVARSVHLLVPELAAALYASERTDRSILEHMQEAALHGVRFLACTEALRAQGLEGRKLIPECQGHGGSVQFMARAIDLRWRTLVF